MRYRRPFTAAQRRDAVSKYRSFKRPYQTLRFEYPPDSNAQRRVLKDYRAIIRSFGAELARQLGTDAEILNRLEAQAYAVIAQYIIHKSSRGKP